MNGLVDLLGGWPGAAVGTIALIFAGALIVAGDMWWPRLICALVLTGSAGLTNGTIGTWIHGTITSLDRGVSPMVGRFTGLGVALTASVGVTVVAIVMVAKNKINTMTLVLVALVPILNIFIPGPAGTAAMTITGIIPATLGGILNWAFWGAWT